MGLFIYYYGFFYIITDIRKIIIKDDKKVQQEAQELLNSGMSKEQLIQEAKKNVKPWLIVTSITEWAWYIVGLSTAQYSFFIFLIILNILGVVASTKTLFSGSRQATIALRICTIIVTAFILLDFYITNFNH